jgi:hypothetical protein
VERVDPRLLGAPRQGQTSQAGEGSLPEEDVSPVPLGPGIWPHNSRPLEGAPSALAYTDVAPGPPNA